MSTKHIPIHQRIMTYDNPDSSRMSLEEIANKREILKSWLDSYKSQYFAIKKELDQEFCKHAPFQVYDTIRVYKTPTKKGQEVFDCIVVEVEASRSAKYEYNYQLRRVNKDGSIGDYFRLMRVEKMELVRKSGLGPL